MENKENTEDKEEHLRDAFRNYNMEVNENQLHKFLLYYNMLMEKNQVMNLTAITKFEDVVEKHFIDSLSVIRAVDLTQHLSVMDIGTGAGFPGVPLAIVFPQLKITLADSLNKRVLFLKDVIDSLQLSNVEAVHGRAEDLGHLTEYREKYDLVLSRAVANLSTLSEYCMPFIKQGGLFVAYKAGDTDEEVKSAKEALRKLGGEVQSVLQFKLGEYDRSLVVIHKVRETPRKYPRKAGTPSRAPLN